MHAPPNELEGMASLWNIVAQAEEAKVNEAAVSLLIQIHTHLDATLLSRLPEFEDHFIATCIDTIEANLKSIGSRTEEQKVAVSKAVSTAEKKVLMVQEKRISLAMRCLTRLIQNSEREGTFGLTSHRAFAQGTDIDGVEIENAFNYEANTGYQKSFKLNLKSNMNFWQVKKMICRELAHKVVDKIQEVPPHPCAIKLVLKRYLDRPIKDSENGLLVQELFMKAGEKILVLPRGNEDLLNKSLLETGSNKMTAMAKQATKSLFEKFAIASAEAPDLLFLDPERVKQLMVSVSA